MPYTPYRPLRRTTGGSQPAGGTPASEPGPAAPAGRHAGRTRPGRGKGFALVACGVLFVVLCVAVATDLARRGTPAPAGGASVAPLLTQGAPAASAVDPAATLGHGAHPKTLLSVDGRGSSQTAQFTTGADWYLRYNYQCPGPDQGGRLQIFEYSVTDSGTPVVDDTDESGTDTLPQHGTPGRRYLRIRSNCTWTVTVLG